MLKGKLQITFLLVLCKSTPASLCVNSIHLVYFQKETCQVFGCKISIESVHIKD